MKVIYDLADRRNMQRRSCGILDRAAALITALDLMETDCDLEENGDDEPSLGWTERGGQSCFTVTAPNPLPRRDR